MAAADSYRGQCNLHLYFAGQYLKNLSSPESESGWGGHFVRAQTEAIIHQLQLAYCAHLADLLTLTPLGFQLPCGIFTASSLAEIQLQNAPSEFSELLEREAVSGWLQDLLGFAYLRQPGKKKTYLESDGVELIGTDTRATGLLDSAEAVAENPYDMAGLQTLHTELSALVTRHRNTLLEY
ncbi:hypothetical protein IB286_05850 [Spongiibacter sp. KMU-158]|uniref:Uncharacterized protein n=1 Tax=Spongiibacter pelagi TaxID=2760804 RepID=A0A927GVW9_9GAMM|nr:hypothetical protein [Spongiibacter pelagi]MBD2858528.1 hypothetical protein [Spongiibacter pelagi]